MHRPARGRRREVTKLRLLNALRALALMILVGLALMFK